MFQHKIALVSDMCTHWQLFFALSWSLLGGFTHLGVPSNGQPWACTRWLASQPWIWAAWRLRVKPLGTTERECSDAQGGFSTRWPPQARAGSMTLLHTWQVLLGSGPPRGHSHICMRIGVMSRPVMVSGLWQTRSFRKDVLWGVQHTLGPASSWLCA